MRTRTYSDERVAEIASRLDKIDRGVQLDFAHLPHNHPDGRLLGPIGARSSIMAIQASHVALVRLLEASGVFTWDDYAKAVIEELDLEIMHLERRIGLRINSTVEIL